MWQGTHISEVHAASMFRVGPYHNTTRSQNPEELDLNIHRRESVKFRKIWRKLSSDSTEMNTKFW